MTVDQTTPPDNGNAPGSAAAASHDLPPPDAARPRWWRLLRGGDADPWWSRPALIGVLALSAFLNTWMLSINGYANTYYAAAVLSATKSWKAFFYGALDAESFITVDKPPLAVWLPALVARVFGFSSWTLLLPQAVMGVLTVAVLHHVVRRAFGHAAALVAALALAVTPTMVAISRHNNPDTLLVLLMVLGAWACATAVRSGRLAPLLWCAVAIGLAFNTKMLQSYLVVPGFALAYLVAAPPRLRRRLANLAVTGVVLAVVSFSWAAVVDLTPAGDRPYVGGSRNNTVTELIVNYNGLGRIFGQQRVVSPGLGGATRGGPTIVVDVPPGVEPPDDPVMRGPGADGRGWDRLLVGEVGGQIAWLLPLAVIGLVVGLWQCGRAPRTDPRRADLILWGGWLVVHYGVFSFARGIWHTYYTSAMAPAVAALAGIGVAALVRRYRSSPRGAWLLPASLAVSGAWAVVLLRRSPDFLPWLAPTVGIVVATVTIALLVPLMWRRISAAHMARLVTVTAVVAVAALLAGPSAYAATALSTTSDRTFPSAGPRVQGGPPAGGRRVVIDPDRGAPPAGGQPDGVRRLPGGPRSLQRPGVVPPDGGPAGPPRRVPDRTVDPALIAYLRAHRGDARWLVATVGSLPATSIILATGGEPVMAMGGFNGNDPAPTLDQFQAYLASGELRFVLTTSFGMSPAPTSILGWIATHCTVVDRARYGGTSPADPQADTLYDCAGAR